MKKSLRILLVEDSQEDALLLSRSLKQGNIEPDIKRVETADDMKNALNTETWDIVLADYNLPHFNALGALKVLQQSGLDLPFIIVSGSIGEESAINALKLGA